MHALLKVSAVLIHRLSRDRPLTVISGRRREAVFNCSSKRRCHHNKRL